MSNNYDICYQIIRHIIISNTDTNNINQIWTLFYGFGTVLNISRECLVWKPLVPPWHLLFLQLPPPISTKWHNNHLLSRTRMTFYDFTNTSGTPVVSTREIKYATSLFLSDTAPDLEKILKAVWFQHPANVSSLRFLSKYS